MRLFDSVKIMAPGRNKFNLSRERKFSFNMGDVVPLMVQEVVPGDSFRVSPELMMRLAPMLAPIMHRVNVKIEHFFVPNRLVWSEWEDFITGGRLGTSAPVTPKLSIQEIGELNSQRMGVGTLWDYMGLPAIEDGVYEDPDFVDVPVSALPFRAYQMIWNEYYRDQNLTAELTIPLTSGIITDTTEKTMLTTLRKRAWEKDYLTSALPFAQRGSTVGVPLTADPIGNPTVARWADDGTPVTAGQGFEVGADGIVIADPLGGGVNLGPEGHDINVQDLRRSIRLQEWLELAARVGGRYVEVLKGFFNVRPDDARLQRPEFLGGGTTPVQISEVLSTVQQVNSSSVPIGTPQGDMTGRGMSYGNQNGFKRFFKEHGHVISVVSCLPRTAYQQGINRMWTRDDKFDYYWKQFANIGEQSVLQQEAWYYGLAPSGDPLPSATFGYQSRYAEYKYAESTVHGDFKTTLAYWHMGRIFTAPPELNESFITSDPTHRIFAVDDPAVHKLWCQCYIKFDAVRPMPYYGTPTL